jgi:hypothetical protein
VKLNWTSLIGNQSILVTRSYFKNADCVQGQEAHLNLYKQMCHPAYAGAQTDPPSLKSYGGTSEKAQSRQRRDEQYILRRSATP